MPGLGEESESEDEAQPAGPDPRVMLALTVQSIRGFQRDPRFGSVPAALQDRVRTSGGLMGTYQMNMAMTPEETRQVADAEAQLDALLQEVRDALDAVGPPPAAPQARRR